jgi:hypothetical protein
MSFFMKYPVALLTVTLIGTTSLNAQIPITQPPTGRTISGWAVEVLPIQNDRDSRRGRRGSNINSLDGQMAIALVSVSAHELSSESLPGDTRPTAYRGRAFLRVRAPLKYAFVVSATANNNSANENCFLSLSVGERVLINDRFDSIGRYHRGPMEAARLNGSTQLEPGFYPIEFVTYCDGRKRSQIRLQFLVRDELSSTPRRFLQDELFHISR